MQQFILKNYLSIILLLGILAIILFVRKKIKNSKNTTEFGLMVDFFERTN